MKKLILAVFLIAATLNATVLEMSSQTGTGASSTLGVDCTNANQIQATAHDAGSFSGAVDIEYRPNALVAFQKAKVGATLELTYIFSTPGYYRFNVTSRSAGAISGTIDAYSTRGRER